MLSDPGLSEGSGGVVGLPGGGPISLFALCFLRNGCRTQLRKVLELSMN